MQGNGVVLRSGMRFHGGWQQSALNDRSTFSKPLERVASCFSEARGCETSLLALKAPSAEKSILNYAMPGAECELDIYTLENT